MILSPPTDTGPYLLSRSAQCELVSGCELVKRSAFTLLSPTGGTCFCPCLFVCLSVSKITQKHVCGFG